MEFKNKTFLNLKRNPFPFSFRDKRCQKHFTPRHHPIMFGAESYGLDDDEPEAWPEVSQQKLDEALRCAICGDLFTMPVR